MSKVLDTRKVPLSTLKEWEDNPRSITKNDFNRLKKQIQKLGVYQPIVVNEDMIVLSGNMRLKAFKDLHIDSVWITVVEAKKKSEMLEYALSANDTVGYYEEEDLSDLLMGAEEEIPLGDYKVNIGNISLDKLLTKFSPGDELSAPEGILEKPGKKITCPKCGHEFYEQRNTRGN